MKISILLLALLTFQNFALGIGGEGGGGGAGGNGGAGAKLAKRSIASVESEDQSVDEIVNKFGKDCLQTLGSSYKGNSQDKDYRTKLDSEIELALNLKMKDRSPASVDGIRFPECFAYAKETNNEKVKLMLVKKKSIINTGHESEDIPSSGNSISK